MAKIVRIKCDCGGLNSMKMRWNYFRKLNLSIITAPTMSAKCFRPMSTADDRTLAPIGLPYYTRQTVCVKVCFRFECEFQLFVGLNVGFNFTFNVEIYFIRFLRLVELCGDVRQR